MRKKVTKELVPTALLVSVATVFSAGCATLEEKECRDMQKKDKEVPMKTLKEAYRDYFDIGVAISPRVLSRHGDMIKAQFGSVTCENEMKFASLHPRPGEYTFEQADAVVDFALAQGMKVRGHTLVWHNQTPAWLFTDDNGDPVDKETLYARMKEHISTVVGRYAGKVYCWDVVNEVVSNTDGGYLDVGSPYYKIVESEEYIEKAFRYAHEADPDALLFLNDYGTEEPNARRDNIYRLLKSLLAKGVPVHGVGLQAHYDYTLDMEELRKTIDMFSSLGLVIHITEMDVSLYVYYAGKENALVFDAPPEDRMKQQAELYEAIFALLREKKDVIGSVTFWGLSDAHSWLSNWPVKGKKNWPMLFDDSQQPKEAYYKVINF